ncbi:MAG: N-carbamoylputrescine amidase [Lachnospiraceae bacterium]
MRIVKAAVTQMACGWDRKQNLKTAEELVREAAGLGANIILLQELFETPYFCQKQDFQYYELATEPDANPAILHFQKIAEELQVVIPVSFYEKAGNTAFNSVAVIDADGSVLGCYRKTHIPDGLPYAEKFYFTPGDTGFKVWKTRYAQIGVGICWDQWFPETARAMALLGAELLLYPTAIGSEPTLELDSKEHWQRCMQGHSAANLMPVIASNRIGTETDRDSGMTFYGSSFITDETGQLLQELNRTDKGVLVQALDLDKISQRRREWGVFRDRRPKMYEILSSHGKQENGC